MGKGIRDLELDLYLELDFELDLDLELDLGLNLDLELLSLQANRENERSEIRVWCTLI